MFDVRTRHRQSSPVINRRSRRVSTSAHLTLSIASSVGDTHTRRAPHTHLVRTPNVCRAVMFCLSVTPLPVARSVVNGNNPSVAVGRRRTTRLHPPPIYPTCFFIFLPTTYHLVTQNCYCTPSMRSCDASAGRRLAVYGCRLIQFESGGLRALLLSRN